MKNNKKHSHLSPREILSSLVYGAGSFLLFFMLGAVAFSIT